MHKKFKASSKNIFEVQTKRTNDAATAALAGGTEYRGDHFGTAFVRNVISPLQEREALWPSIA
jgi:hypothetical protein